MADRELERKRNNSILDEESQDSSEPASKKQRTSYDAYADVSLHGNLKPSQLGRGVDSGYVRCSLCPPSSKKTFARGRGLRTHMDSIHKPALNTEEEIKEWEETARNAVLESEKNVATQKWGSKNVSAQVVKDPDWLIFVKEGKLEELKKLVEGGWDPKSSKDKHGATAEHWAAGCGHLECLTYLISVGAEVKGSQSVPSSKRQKRRDGRTSLHWAARNGHLNVIEWMISSEGECGNDIDICTAGEVNYTNSPQKKFD
ncbi:hypothetical protein HK098_001594 [Nowakowskiella sp. JEL0407]|nr:hypothetical protein HK098_001594 [Nowakowskiella sp. JEL0407]